MREKENIVIYQGEDGRIELRADFDKETFWASQDQIAKLFGIDQSVISRHVSNIFKDGEIEEKSNMQKMHSAKSDKPVTIYSLDVILAVGYRTNSRQAIIFRKWATATLRDYLVSGYAFNQYRLNQAPEVLEGLNEAISFLESTEHGGILKGKITLNLTKKLTPKK